jgi:hypothetical protein
LLLYTTKKTMRRRGGAKKTFVSKLKNIYNRAMQLRGYLQKHRGISRGLSGLHTVSKIVGREVPTLAAYSQRAERMGYGRARKFHPGLSYSYGGSLGGYGLGGSLGKGRGKTRRRRRR